MASLACSIALISFLYRREELAVPSWPAESIRTGMASGFAVVTSRMLPIKQLLSTFSPGPKAPIQITLLAVLTPKPATAPKAVLLLPMVLLGSAKIPLAVLLLPVVLLKSALKPLGRVGVA